MLIHTKPISKLKLSSAISYALITLLTPVISVATNYSSVFAIQRSMNFSVVVSDVPFLSLELDDNVTLDLTPKAISSAFATENFWAKVNTTNESGYRLTMKTDQPNLTSTSGGTLPSLLPDATNYPNGYTCTMETVNTSSCTFTDNSWGYKLSSNTTYPNNYLPLTTDSVLLNASNNKAEDAYTYIDFASKVNASQAAGTYSTTIDFILVANVVADTCPAGYICYESNMTTSELALSPKMANQSATSNTATTLWASNYKRDGYGFLGWNTSASGTGTTYGPNQTLTADEVGDLSQAGKTLYAKWLQASNRYTMQTFTDAVCKNELVTTVYNSTTSTLTTSERSVIALEDERDGNVYAVARLADGNCWMIENLRLDNTAELTAKNTNNPSLPLTNIYNADPSLATTSNYLTSSASTWCNSGGIECIDQSIIDTTNISQSSSMTFDDNTSLENYSYGVYYNWYSATAGNGLKSTQYANGDICPSNWRLFEIYDNNSGEFSILDIAMGGNGNGYNDNSQSPSYAEQLQKYISFPNNIVMAGFKLESTIRQRGSTFGYWSASANANNYYDAARFFGGSTNSSEIWVRGNNIKWIGYTVRCLAGN